MKTAVVYARYSSERQTEQSIEGQLRVCTEYAKSNDIVIVDTYIDRAMTGTNDNRTDFQRMLKDASKQAWDYILVYKLDRFSRNKYEMAMHKKTLRDNGIKLLSAMENIPDTPEGIILESLLEGMAEYYSAELSQKVKRGKRECRLKGNFVGGVIPFGYKVVDKKAVINDDEASIVRRIFEEYAIDKFVKDIISDLKNDGITFRGKPFARSSVYKILKNPIYDGKYYHDGELFTNIYPRIVSERIFEIVHNKMEENRYGKHDSDAVYLLKNKMKCGYCNKTITSESGTSQNGTINRYYKCYGRKNQKSGCMQKPLRKDVLENLVVDATLKVFENTANLSVLADKIIELHEKRTKDTSVLNMLIKEKEQLAKSIDNILDAIAEGYRTSKTKEKLEELEARLDIVEGKILTEKAKERTSLTKQDIVKFISKCIKKEPQQMIKLLVKEIVLYNDRIDIHYNYIDKIRPDDYVHQAFSFYSTEVVIDTKEDCACRKEQDYIKMLLTLCI